MTTNIQPFNRATEKAFAVGRVSFSMTQRRTRFDSNAANIIGARPHMFVHFVPIGDDWYLFVNEDQEGYMLSKTAKRAGLSVNNTTFIRWFFAKQKIREKAVHYSVVPTDKKYKENQLFLLIPVIQ